MRLHKYDEVVGRSWTGITVIGPKSCNFIGFKAEWLSGMLRKQVAKCHKPKLSMKRMKSRRLAKYFRPSVAMQQSRTHHLIIARQALAERKANA